jgi:hypothetical protein
MSDVQLNDPQTLYRRWDDSMWSPFDVDLRPTASIGRKGTQRPPATERSTRS